MAQALESQIDAVTVYPRGADVTRVARVSLAPGANLVMLEGFPANIDLARVRAAAGDERVEVRSIALDVREQQEAFDPEVQRLEAAIIEVKDAIEATADEVSSAELQLKFLEGLSQEFALRERTEAAAGQADIASWQQALDSIGSGASAAMEKIRGARKAQRDLEMELSKLERELENQQERSAASAALRLSLVSEDSLEAGLSITYFQRQARWRSSYAAYLDTESSELRLVHEAQVRQTTGENWGSVELTLSTGNPGGAMQAPDQDSRFLDLFDPEARMQERQQAGAYALSAMSTRMEEDGLGAQVIAGRYAVRYQASERADIPNAADQTQTVPLTEYRRPVALVTRTTPRQDPRAYLTAAYTHESETALFGGPMRVFVDGAFTGLTELGELLPGAEAALPLGPDPQIKVRAIDQGGEKGREGFRGNRKTELTDYLFEIVNRASRATTVEVIDYYPVSRDEKIEVKIAQSATAPEEKDMDDRPGVIAWRKELAPGESWRITHQYEVSYPKDATLADPW